MRAFVALVADSQLRRFLPEDALPEDLIPQLTREWPSAPTAAIRAVLRDEDAEAVREELAAGRRRDACGVLLDRAVEVHLIAVGDEDHRQMA